MCRRKREAAAKQEAQSERTTERQRQRQAAFVPPKVISCIGFQTANSFCWLSLMALRPLSPSYCVLLLSYQQQQRLTMRFGQSYDCLPSGSQEAEAAPAARGSAAVTDASAADLDALAARLRSAAEASAQQRRDRGGAAASDFLAPSGGGDAT
jgi:hypothetical protein